MKHVRIPYYSIRNGNGYWEPRGRMRLLGFEAQPCGPDGPDAWAQAQALNARWARVRTSVDGPVNGDVAGQTAATRTMGEDTVRDRKQGYVYFIEAGGDVKVGFTTRALVRLDEIRTSVGKPITRVAVVRGTRRDEKRLHQQLSAYRRRGEWFVGSPVVFRIMYRTLAVGFLAAVETEREPDSE